MTAAVDDVTKKSKNINMDMRKTPQSHISKDGLKIRSGRRLRAVEKDSKLEV